MCGTGRPRSDHTQPRKRLTATTVRTECGGWRAREPLARPHLTPLGATKQKGIVWRSCVPTDTVQVPLFLDTPPRPSLSPTQTVASQELGTTL